MLSELGLLVFIAIFSGGILIAYHFTKTFLGMVAYALGFALGVGIAGFVLGWW